MREIIVVAHNIRSTHNVGSIFRTCDGFGVTKLILSGYTPHPVYDGDRRLPHISGKLTQQIHKTSLGAERTVPFEYTPDIDVASLRRYGFQIIGLEQDHKSVRIQDVRPSEKIALILGEEVNGIGHTIKDMCDLLVEIPMHGTKESFNVSVATGIALYALSQQ